MSSVVVGMNVVGASVMSSVVVGMGVVGASRVLDIDDGLEYDDGTMSITPAKMTTTNRRQ